MNPPQFKRRPLWLDRCNKILTRVSPTFPDYTVFRFKCCRVKFLKSATTRVNDIRQTVFPHQIGILGSLEEPITLARRFCCQARFIASTTVRRTGEGVVGTCKSGERHVAMKGGVRSKNDRRLWRGNSVAGVLRQENMAGLQPPKDFQPPV